MANLATRGTWDHLAGLTDIMRFDPFKEFGIPLQRYFDRDVSAFAPSFEVKETKDALVLKADLPGVKNEDLDVSVHGNVLTIGGKREQEIKKDEEQYHMVERSFGSFMRSFTLPDGIDAKSLDAELKDGVLTVTLPKGPKRSRRRLR